MSETGRKIEPAFNRVAVIGLGLIGGSVAGAARASALAGHVCGFATGNHANEALRLGLIDEACTDALDAVADADLVVIATPVTTMRSVFVEIAGSLKPTAVVTDCGSTKESIIHAARETLGGAFDRFIPGHPISGSEFSGPGAARANLFDQKLWLLAPVNDRQKSVSSSLQALLDSFGAQVELIEAAVHDALFAEYSHAPHALVFAICQAVADGPNAPRLRELAGAGFRDTTRIGASSPDLWTDILMDNRAPVVEALDRYLESMSQMRTHLDRGDKQAVLNLLKKASAWRASLD